MIVIELSSKIHLLFIFGWYSLIIKEFLASGNYDKTITSAKHCDQAGVYIYEYADFGGSYFYMPPGSTWSMLTFQGWNDRISSIWALG
ncbi:hypothetical protein Dehly_1551 [Dehalogenimonas lykanthroporepellens BL-DC-9]|nr:hypothetical protein Dehly_1551 [Dehalogenimonas lykanthroporepellens BL-DC-9]